MPEVTWDEVFMLLDDDVKNGRKHGQKRFKFGGYKIRQAHRIKPVREALENLLEVLHESPLAEEEGSDHQIYMSLTTDPSAYGGPHVDYENVIFWQLQGYSRWQIYDKTNSEIEFDKVIGPGDVLYCPNGRMHNVIASSPRFGVSLGFGELRERL
jgi:ribosomal protein L16 Arg81 hydroxylase